MKLVNKNRTYGLLTLIGVCAGGMGFMTIAPAWGDAAKSSVSPAPAASSPTQPRSGPAAPAILPPTPRTTVSIQIPEPVKPPVLSSEDAGLINAPTPGGLGRVDPDAGLYPDAGLPDFSSVLRPPAGRFGFLSARPDGHFHWADGQRARFWGVCISRRSVELPHKEIARVCNGLARAGCNMVRFEALDAPGGILDGSTTDSQHFDSPFLDSLDFWLACLRARGIYYYLDLLDFRHFQAGDGVPNAAALGIAARPYAIFDPRLIQLQEDYARQLLTTTNPYTNLRPVDDPAMVMVELVNEHGLFMSVTRLHQLAAPYNVEFQALWNAWLVVHYKDRNTLNDHWKAAAEPLRPDEDPAKGSVLFTAMPTSESNYDHGGIRSIRIRDQVDFLADTQRRYFETMRDYLRSIGLRCPLTAAVTSVVAPDVLSVADALDCTTENFYADHPKFAGAEWAGNVYYNDNDQLASSSPDEVAPQISVLRWNNKPVVIREWCTAWPNHYRATSIPDMAAYASLQDLDMVLLFTYVTGPPSGRLMDFAIESDPTVWGLFGVGSKLFLENMIAPAKYGVDLVYSSYDLEHWGPYLNQLHRLAWCSLVRNLSTGEIPQTAHGISVLSGRGGWAESPKENSLLFQRMDAVPPPDRESAAENIVKSNHIPLVLSPIADHNFRFNGILYPENFSRPMESDVGFLTESLPGTGYVPVGLDAVGQIAFGAYNPNRHMMVLPLVTAREALVAALDLLRLVGANVMREQVEVDRWHSDTGEITRDPGAGRLTVTTPNCAIVAGEFSPGSDVSSGPLNVHTQNAVGTVSLISMDKRPFETMREWYLKSVTYAENTGQELVPAPRNAPGSFVLRKEGSPPVVTRGEASEPGMSVRLGSTLLAEVNMTGGSWELYYQDGKYDFNCDTPGIRVQLARPGKLFAVGVNGQRIPLPGDWDGSFLYPAGVLGVELLPAK